jgi:hypothetical protein
MVHLSIPSKLKPGSKSGAPDPSGGSTLNLEQEQGTPSPTLIVQVAVIQVHILSYKAVA